jgi:hypothetical protein
VPDQTYDITIRDDVIACVRPSDGTYDCIEDHAVIIPLLVDACDDARERFAQRGIRLELQIPREPGDKTGVRLDASSARGLAQLLLWDTGELDLTIGDADTGDILLSEHREVTSKLGISDALNTIEAYLSVG